MATLSPAVDDDALWASLEADSRPPAEDAAASHLNEGRPIYYSEPDTPDGLIIKEYPDGIRRLIRISIVNGEAHEVAA